MVGAACMWSGVETLTESNFTLSNISRQSAKTWQPGNAFLTHPDRPVSTSATATSLQCLLRVRDLMSASAMPPAPTLACSTVSLGAAGPWARKTNGAAMPAATPLRAVRRVMRRGVIGVGPGRGWASSPSLTRGVRGDRLDGDVAEGDRVVVPAEPEVALPEVLAGVRP